MGFQRTMKAVSDPTRREILNMLKNGSMTAGQICEKFDITSASISHHLSILKECDLVIADKVGKYIFYEINTTVIEEILVWFNNLRGENDEN